MPIGVPSEAPKPTVVDANRPRPTSQQTPEADLAGEISDVLDDFQPLPNGQGEDDDDNPFDDSEDLDEGSPEDGEGDEEEDEEEPEGVDPEDAEEPEASDDKDTVIAQLRKRLAEMSVPSSGASGQETQPQDSTQPAPQATQVQLAELELTDEEVSDALDSPEKLKDLLKKVVNSTREQVLRSIPDVIESQVQRTTQQQQLVQDFWKENSELQDYRSFISYLTQEVQGQNPDWTAPKVLEEVAKRAYTELNIKKKAAAVDGNSRKRKGSSAALEEVEKPALPRRQRSGSARGGSKDERSSIQKEIDDTLIGI